MNAINPSKNRSRTKSATRRRWSAAEKAIIVRRYLRDGATQADLADEYGVAPGQISQWCKQALEGVENIFKGSARKTETTHQKELQLKEKKIHQLQDVVKELSTEVLQLKKSNGVC